LFCLFFWIGYKTIVQYKNIVYSDRWETCYGELTFDDRKFPDPKQMNSELHTQVFCHYYYYYLLRLRFLSCVVIRWWNLKWY
jgi:hypothetical protein